MHSYEGAACSTVPGFSTGAAGCEVVPLLFCTIRFLDLSTFHLLVTKDTYQEVPQ